ncbi:MAG TPA: LCP family protein [Ktedonobacterales bacterium]|jgi:LCP family protein required for cell wall assembly
MPRGGYYPTQTFGYDPMQPVRPDGLQEYYQPPAPWPKSRKRRRWGRWVALTFLVLLIIVVALGVIVGQRAYAFGQAISTQSPLSSQIDLNGTNRVNLLVMGFGGGNHPGAYLTDSMLIISIQPQTGQTALISVPRDLWVQIPPDSGRYGKLNSAYEYGLDNGYGTVQAGKVAAGDITAQKLSDVTGLSVKYWMTLDFSGFRELVDALGGVDVNVQHSFTALYPKNDDPSIDASWITVTFKAGPQHMDGAHAIEYARAREVTGGDPTEGTDFARSARQQILIKAIVSKMTQVSEWPHLFGAMDALQKSIYTNLSALDLYHFVGKMDLNNAKHIGLSNQNVLVDSSTDDGQYILQPRNGNWDLVKQYIQQQLGKK